MLWFAAHPRASGHRHAMTMHSPKQAASTDLASRYLGVLADFDTALLDRHAPHADAEKLSGLFLPSVPPNWLGARQRIMIVGCETRQWNVLPVGERFSSLEYYVERSMAVHQAYFAQQLSRADIKGRAFHNFTRAVARRSGSDGLIYANLLCMAWNKGSPVKCRHFEVIKKYSKLLLDVQIDFFQPEIIIFANGSATAGHRRDFFPLARDAQGKAIGTEYAKQHIPNAQLWKFPLDHRDCYRIQHPSSRSPSAARAREFLLGLLPAR
ncbi:hypothetical protein [Janthinobacterium sp. SUN206]|uniref:hypothetical protein n=1 Tax=Janthinobacterium sp. SUN206 TaxID=3014787 RepID=UPI0027134E97|nr:hypothetical protein [Janthinobacterium sp. SUN206]MDO8069078.1 hypothetical protein [Janthinobacterium sp. SUN206]